LTTPTLAGYFPDLLMHTDYYSFGMEMPGRKWVYSDYRQGFNGKEKADEITVGDYDFGARVYDSRIGRFFSVDPKAQEHPSESPYSFAANNPIRLIDKNGESPGDPDAKHDRKLERFKKRNETQLEGLKAYEIEDRFANSRGFFGMGTKLVKQTKWYQEWRSRNNVRSQVTGFKLETPEPVVIESGSQSALGSSSTEREKDVEFNKGTFVFRSNSSGGPNGGKVNVAITDEEGNTVYNGDFNVEANKSFQSADIPFSKAGKKLKVTVTASYVNANGQTVSDRPAWDLTMTPDKDELSPKETQVDAKPKYNLKRK
jgi:RHS repeat-associated protein